jgi:membrane protein
MVGPILVFSALGITATVMNIEVVRGLMAIDVLGQLVQTISRLVPYLLIIAAFTFIYMFMPNTRVRLWPALVGGIRGRHRVADGGLGVRGVHRRLEQLRGHLLPASRS